ncbi:MAG: ATP-binding protein [Desulfarculaceae bacterium]|nr:ATP-binding protein [Desulfarculaceae bacterium]
MIPKPIDQITKEDIEALVAQQREEDKTLEYKRNLPRLEDSIKKEKFLGLVSSLANSAGGDIVYGIVEAQENGKNSGKPEDAIGVEAGNADQTKLQLQQVIRVGVEPRIIPEVSFQSIEGFERGPVFVVRVPRSIARPHMVWLSKRSQFYARSSNGTYPLDVAEIRAAFVGAEENIKRIKRFINERIGKIIAGEVPTQVNEGGKSVLHILPLASFDYSQPQFFDISLENGKGFPPISASSWNSRHNFDGYLLYHANGYTQMFRNGALEAVDSYCTPYYPGKENGPEKYIASQILQEHLIRALRNYLESLKRRQVPTPLYFSYALIDIKGYVLAVKGMEHRHTIKESHLVFPAFEINNYGVEPQQIIKPILDMLWQSVGYEKCYSL